MKYMLSLLLTCCFVHFSFADTFDVEQDDTGVTVKLKGELFTRYLIKSGAKPVLWPVVGPDGVKMTRQYPIEDALEFEKQDHVHHRSFWFTHGNVNGVDFWAETDNHGNIVHKKFEKVSGGDTAKIISLNDWVGPDGETIGSDQRALTFGVNGENRWIDCDITFTAGEKTVVFGDTKEGSFGLRVAGSMKVEAEQGGEIVNSQGLKDKEAWGKPAGWVDYHGRIGEKVYGIAIMNHPSSYGYPTHWHVRTYGLFAANPFGLKDFYGKDSGKDGALTLKPGESFSLRYRVVLHRGNETDAHIAELFKEYEKTEK